MAADQTGTVHGQLVAALLRQRKLIIVVALLATGAGLAAGLLTTTLYTATASTLVSPLEGNPYSPQGRGDDLLNLETEAQLVKTDAVAKMVKIKLRSGDSPGELRAKVTVQVPPNTQVLNISFAANGPAQARDGAQAFADSYLAYRRQRTQAILDGKLKKLHDSSRRVEAVLQTATTKLQSSTGSQRAYWNTRVQAYSNQLGVIEEQSNDVRSTPINPGQVISPALPPTTPAAMRPLMFAGAGLVIGLLLAVTIVLLRMRTDRRVHSTQDLEQLGVPVLSTVPRPRLGEGSLALASAPKGGAGDAYRRLRASIVAGAPPAPVALLVTAATPGRSSTVVSSNLAVALALAGSATIMVDAASSEPDPAPFFGLRHSRGLSDALLGGVDPAELLVHADSQLRLLPRGGDPVEATHRFSGPRMREAIDVLRRRAGFVVVNADSVSDADAQALLALADAVVLVVTLGVTTRDELEQAYAEAERTKTLVIGVVVDTPPGKRARRAEDHARRLDVGGLPAAPADDREIDIQTERRRSTPASPTSSESTASSAAFGSSASAAPARFAAASRRPEGRLAGQRAEGASSTRRRSAEKATGLDAADPTSTMPDQTAPLPVVSDLKPAAHEDRDDDGTDLPDKPVAGSTGTSKAGQNASSGHERSSKPTDDGVRDVTAYWSNLVWGSDEDEEPRDSGCHSEESKESKGATSEPGS
ncbi:Wzz/FepE/Etk N-terminal domain-containing protein [Actinomadura fulvescens]|uniref:Polysaccharide chain length determinant N-terminal domain-containing protein n=1 Tax=Actinomadura fulvescens TaxID=46160 RepID=A0ABN3PW14_9ACTN